VDFDEAEAFFSGLENVAPFSGDDADAGGAVLARVFPFDE
jgi:hypothetical protein